MNATALEALAETGQWSCVFLIVLHVRILSSVDLYRLSGKVFYIDLECLRGKVEG